LIEGILLDVRHVHIPFVGLSHTGICRLGLYLSREGDGSAVIIRGGGDVSEDFYHSLVTAKQVSELTCGKRFETDIILEQPKGVKSTGDSGGLIISLALLSMLTKTPLNPAITGTGSIDSNGNVYPVGHIKDKALAARDSGIKRFLMPYDSDFLKLPRGLEYLFVASVSEAWDYSRLSC
jgi:ATP-dependent Lon protease